MTLKPSKANKSNKEEIIGWLIIVAAISISFYGISHAIKMWQIIYG